MASPIIKYITQDNQIHVTVIALPAFNFAPTLHGRKASLTEWLVTSKLLCGTLDSLRTTACQDTELYLNASSFHSAVTQHHNRPLPIATWQTKPVTGGRISQEIIDGGSLEQTKIPDRTGQLSPLTVPKCTVANMYQITTHAQCLTYTRKFPLTGISNAWH